MDTKICTIPDPEPDPPPDPCKEQRIRNKIKAGIKICPPKPPAPPPPPVPSCIAICRERIKNFPIPVSKHDEITVCVVERETTPHTRCDEIWEKVRAHPDIPYPGCPYIPPPPPPPSPDPCEEIAKRNKRLECLERMKRYRE